MRSPRSHASVVSTGLLAALALAAVASLTGCDKQLIPNTDIEDTNANRETVEFVERYRVAMEHRSPDEVLSLVAVDYFDDNGTPVGTDDTDYASLREGLSKLSRLIAVRYDIRYRRISHERDQVFVDYTYTGSFRIHSEEGDRWEQRLADNRIVLRRSPRGELVIVSGL